MILKHIRLPSFRFILALLTSPLALANPSPELSPQEAPSRDPVSSILNLYPAPEGIPPSAHYAVTINGQTSFVYMTTGPNESEFNKGHTSSWTSFDFEGTVDVRIRPLKREVKSVTVRPQSRNIPAQIVDGEIRMELDQPAKLSIECDGDLRNVLFLFANAPEEDVPSADDPKVVWFGPGVHDVGKFYSLKPDTTYYLAPGAFLKGSFAGGGEGTRVIGRGILSGSQFKWPGHLMEKSSDRVDLLKLEGDGLEISGITLVDSPYYVIRARGKGNRFQNLKVLAWYHNTDALSSGPGARIDDCFFRASDDILKPFESDTQITRCVIWADRAAPFQLTWNARQDSGGSVVRDCDVIHHMPFFEKENEWTGAVFWSWHGGPGHIHDILFEDIRIEGPSPYFINLFIKRNPWSPQEGAWGRFSRLHFRNITVEQPSLLPNRILGHDENHLVDGVTFENVKIGGKWIRSAEDMNLVTNAFVRNLKFIAPPPDVALKD